MSKIGYSYVAYADTRDNGISLVPAAEMAGESIDDPIPQRFVDMILQYLADGPHN